MILRNVFCAAVAQLCIATSVVFAQGPVGFNRPLQLAPKVKPAFHVTPMSQKIESSRGKRIPLEFQIESIDRPTTIRVRSVSLKQEADGTILPDTDRPAPDNLTLLSPARVDLAASETSVIKCRLRVPSTRANYHSFGILVTDLGRIVENRPVKTADNASRSVGIRFVTRYLLRVDVSIKGARGEDASKIEVQSARLVEDHGFPKAEVWIHNPSDGPLEFAVRGRILRGGRVQGKSTFNLIMPSRAAIETQERSIVRILPDARLRLEELLPEPVFPGQYELELSLISNRRTRKKTVHPLEVGSDDFPAQASRVAHSENVKISPSRVELSMRRGGRRRVSVEIENHRPEAIHVTVKRQQQLPGLVTRTTELEIRSGSSRKIALGLDPRQIGETNAYTNLIAEIRGEDGKLHEPIHIPVALLARSEETPEISAVSMAWDTTSSTPAFVQTISNTGSMHLPVHATLSVMDAFGRRVEMESGFGQWLLPGKEMTLRFRTQFAPPPGKYQCQLTIDGNGWMEPVVLTSELEFKTAEQQLISIPPVPSDLPVKPEDLPALPVRQ